MNNSKGQATTEILLLLPLFVILAGGAMSVGYMCWQGIKVQQAANLAARMQGQERVSGGSSAAGIQMDNGVGIGVGDQSPGNGVVIGDGVGALSSLRGSAPPLSSVYGRFYKAAKDFFSPGEQMKMLIPPPVSGVNTDKVQVIRMLTPPKIMGMQMQPITLEATAYGGEDPHMNSLPRWGTVGNGSPFYQSQIKKGKD